MDVYIAWSGGAGAAVVGRAIDAVGANGARGAGRAGVAIFFIPEYFSNHVKMPTIKVKTDTLPQTFFCKIIAYF